MAKLSQLGEKDHAFFCPGCQCGHAIRTSGEKAWQWNGSVSAPTFSPSYLVLGERRLKGKTVDLPEWEDV